MKLSSRARYALRSMVAIARLANEEGPVSLDRVAKKTQISRRYLEQLAIALKNASLVRGVAGRSGGYVLARQADTIRIGEIVEAAIGPINIVNCVLRPEICLRSEECECRFIYDLINRRITEVMNEYTLADLADGTRIAASQPARNGARRKASRKGGA